MRVLRKKKKKKERKKEKRRRKKRVNMLEIAKYTILLGNTPQSKSHKLKNIQMCNLMSYQSTFAENIITC